jgi:hypothetical protein
MMLSHNERLVGALIPRPLPRRATPPAPMPALPTPRLVPDPDGWVLDVARLDRSGRLFARRLLTALGWPAGHHIDITVDAGALLINSGATGRHAVGARGVLAIPSAVRAMVGIDADHPVLLAAHPSSDLLVVYPAQVLARLLATVHGGFVGGRDGC